MKIWVLTGGPKAGKSTTTRSIKRRFGKKVIIVPEAATDLFQGGYPQPGRDCEWNPEWQRDFQREVLKRQNELEEQAIAEAVTCGASLIICDRGSLDGAAFIEGGLEALASLYGLDLAAERARYDRVLHLESVATCKPQLFDAKGNACRYESLPVAIERELATRTAWNQHPGWQFFSGKGKLAETIDRIIQMIAAEVEVEIERKWRFSGTLPNVSAKTEIRQGYLLATESTELRVRLANRTAWLTRKTKGSLARGEKELKISRAALDELWPLTEGAQVSKTRYHLPCSNAKGQVLELDVYRDSLHGLVILEAEFDSVDQAADFRLPEWAASAVEVTEDARYKNKNLARHGRPA